MKPQLLRILICGLLLALAQPSGARKWTDNTAKFWAEAEFVAVNYPVHRILKTRDSFGGHFPPPQFNPYGYPSPIRV